MKTAVKRMSTASTSINDRGPGRKLQPVDRKVKPGVVNVDLEKSSLVDG